MARTTCGRVDVSSRRVDSLMIMKTPSRNPGNRTLVTVPSGYSSSASEAPCERRRVPGGLKPPINGPALEHRREDPQLSCFICRLQGQVRLVPIGPDAVPLKDSLCVLDGLLGELGGSFS